MGSTMAASNFATDNALTVKLWSRLVQEDTLQRLWFRDLMGTGEDAIIQRKDDLQKNQGDRVRFALRNLLGARGFTEGQTMYGNEEVMTFLYDDLVINELRHAAQIPWETNISSQRFITDDMRTMARTALSDWFADRFEVSIFNHLSGNSVVTDDAYRGNNVIVAPSANRVIRAAGQASDQALTSSHVFDINLLDVAVEMAATLTPRIRPGMINGKKRFALFVHPTQAVDIKRATGTGEWVDIELAKLAGGKDSLLMDYEGYLGRYSNIEMYSTKYIPTGVNGSTGAAISTVRRAVLCGAQAATVAFGKGFGRSSFTWDEEKKDYGHDLGVGVSTIWGCKKTKFTDGSSGEDYGVITISSYAAAHTS